MAISFDTNVHELKMNENVHELKMNEEEKKQEK